MQRQGASSGARKAPTRPSGESISAAPIVWDNKVFIGIAGSELGVRGRILALDAATGAIRWQFNTVPQGTEFGVDTLERRLRGRPAAAAPGARSRSIRKRGELFIPVGNPSPDFFLRIGTCDVRRARIFSRTPSSPSTRAPGIWTGTSRPHRRTTRTSIQAAAPMLFKLGDGRTAMAAASKDGYLRVVDRSTHRLIYKLAVTTIKNEDKPVTAKGLETCPGTLGGTQWNGPAYDINGESDRRWRGGLVQLPAPGRVCRIQEGRALLRRQHHLADESDAERLDHFRERRHRGGALEIPRAGSGGVRHHANGGRRNVRRAMSPARSTRCAAPTARCSSASRPAAEFPVASSPTQWRESSTSLSRPETCPVRCGMSSGLPHIIIYTVGDVPPDAGLIASGGNASTERGGGVFVRSCAACHGFGGVGGTGPSLKASARSSARRSSAGRFARRARPRPGRGERCRRSMLQVRCARCQSVQDVIAFL